MLIDGKPYRTIWLGEDQRSVCLIDQRHLPFSLVIEALTDYRQMVAAIRDMHVRGAPLIGAAAAYGVFLAARENAGLPAAAFKTNMDSALAALLAARPTAVNLRWAIERQAEALSALSSSGEAPAVCLAIANKVADNDVAICAALGRHAAALLEQLAARQPGKSLQILTHCNAGWLATVDHGTVTAGIYEAARRGLDMHVWVDETRPRNQGALTAWELTQNGIPNTVICDNSGGHLMQQGLVDIAIVGTDRTVRNGDTANKIGTYLKALAARDNGVPFYIALPSPSFDPRLEQGVGFIPIEERDPAEVLSLRGVSERDGSVQGFRLFAEATKAANYGFDVTPARLISGYITEYGIFDASGLAQGITLGQANGAAAGPLAVN